MGDTALVVIDVQTGMLEGEFGVHDAPMLVERVKGLMARAREANMPIIVVEHVEAPEYDGPLHPDIAPRDEDVLVQKLTPNSFHETNLKQELDAKGIKKLIVAGIQTDMCINATVRAAHDLGYDVTLAKDAHSTFNGPDVIAEYSNALSEVATVKPSAEIEFSG